MDLICPDNKVYTGCFRESSEFRSSYGPLDWVRFIDFEDQISLKSLCDILDWPESNSKIFSLELNLNRMFDLLLKESIEMLRNILKPLMLFGLILIVVDNPAIHAQKPNQLPSMSEIIQAVQAQEELYNYIELIVERNYEFKSKTFKAEEHHLRKSTQVDHSIHQIGNLFFSENKDSGSDRDMKKSFELGERERGSDGKVSRERNQVLFRLIHRSEPLFGRIYPHTIPLKHSWIQVPLSSYLRGGDYLLNEPFGRLHDEKNIKFSVLSFEKIGDELCLKLRQEIWTRNVKKPEHLETYYIWLALEKNYFPLKTLGYAREHLTDEKYPFVLKQVKEFRELKPGLWLPYKTEVTQFDYPIPPSDSLGIFTFETIEITKAELDPRYPISKFQEISMPDKGILKEYDENGKLFRTVEITPEIKAQLTPETNFKWWYWLLILLVFIALIALVFYRRVRSRNRSAVNP